MTTAELHRTSQVPSAHKWHIAVSNLSHLVTLSYILGLGAKALALRKLVPGVGRVQHTLLCHGCASVWLAQHQNVALPRRQRHAPCRGGTHLWELFQTLVASHSLMAHS